MTSRLQWLCLLLLPAIPAGAGDEDHWSFQPIREISVPEVSSDSGSVHPIDAFIDAGLSSAGLQRSSPAPPHTLLRRLHLDLIGLLPAPEEIARFEREWKADPEAAYAKKVDDLLASPHFGEHWGRHWLDLARYGDSDGYLGDSLRPWAWLYRDWVIDAINADQPFDQFSIEQLAGDLIPEATQEQKIAVGFHRNQLKNTEAGADRELDRTKRVVDRVGTTGTTWLGLTLACAECHDHKHDPISQKEFFQLYSFFNNTEEADIAVRLEEEWAEYESKRKEWEETLEVLLGRIPEQEPAAEDPSEMPPGWDLLRPDKVEAAGTELAIQDDASILASGKTPSTVSYFVEVPVEKERRITGFRIDTFGRFGEGRESGHTVGRGENGAFVLSMFFPDLLLDGKTSRIALSAASKGSNREDVAEVLKPSTAGWEVSSDTYRNHSLVFTLAEPVTVPSGSRLRFSLGQKSGTGNSIRHFRILSTSLPEVPEPLEKAPDPTLTELRLPVEEHLASPPAKPTTKAQSLVELGAKDRRTSYIHIRGDYTRKGEEVSPDVPTILHPLDREATGAGTPNRLTLAHWLFEPANPLTARVTANRIWQHLFGEGIVATADDFGTYGARPTHPELLDWLAGELQRNGWRRKALIRTIVLSSTYRQSSANTLPDLSNQLLWRQNSFRVPAETVRDIHLAASGLLERRMGGPGIHPPLPEFVTAVGRSVKWPESTGPDRYRRGLYIFLKRTVLYPMLTTFDAPDTSSACARRERTNTPMQALTLLNDPVFYECAEALGEDLLSIHDERIDAAIEDLFVRSLNRAPTAAERDTLRSAHHDLLQSSGSPALAMTAIARIVLNLDEFITRD